jgi:hypothetical protein
LTNMPAQFYLTHCMEAHLVLAGSQEIRHPPIATLSGPGGVQTQHGDVLPTKVCMKQRPRLQPAAIDRCSIVLSVVEDGVAMRCVLWHACMACMHSLHHSQLQCCRSHQGAHLPERTLAQPAATEAPRRRTTSAGRSAETVLARQWILQRVVTRTQMQGPDPLCCLRPPLHSCRLLCCAVLLGVSGM